MSDAVRGLNLLLEFIASHHGIADKAKLAESVAQEFGLDRDRSVYHCADYAVRFASAAGPEFGNTVLALSRLRTYDDRPFLVCVVTPERNYCLIANTTFLKKISHSSHDLREDNIRGSFNGSDIAREFLGIPNTPENVARLHAIHSAVGFCGNLARLVEATNNIRATGSKFEVSETGRRTILDAPARALRFTESVDFSTLESELDARVEKVRSEILQAARIDNVNVRGRAIEYLIAGEDASVQQQLVCALRSGEQTLPQFTTENTLGDYHRLFERVRTETDVKSKVLTLQSNPKAYNLDKMLEFLEKEHSVFLFYFVGIVPAERVKTVLVPMFQRDLLRATLLLRHWSGRNSRGVAQFEGKTIHDLIDTKDTTIDESASIEFLAEVIALQPRPPA